jgi:DNA transformation protein
MTLSKDFRDQMLGRLLPLGPVLSRSMFGGFGFYIDDIISALSAYDQIYFKVDTGMGQLPYFLVPLEVLNDPIEFAEWAGRAGETAKQSKTMKPTRWKS